MGTSPTSQKFRTVFDFGIPVSFLTNNDVLNALNSVPGWAFDDAIAGAASIENFVSHNISVTSVTVTGSHWEVGQDNSHAVLVSVITTVSDPLDSNTLATFLAAVAIAAVITAAILLILTGAGIIVGVPLIIVEALAAIGILSLIAVIVTEITSPVSGPGGALLGGAILIAAIGLGVAAVGSVFKKR